LTGAYIGTTAAQITMNPEHTALLGGRAAASYAKIAGGFKAGSGLWEMRHAKFMADLNKYVTVGRVNPDNPYEGFYLSKSKAGNRLVFQSPHTIYIKEAGKKVLVQVSTGQSVGPYGKSQWFTSINTSKVVGNVGSSKDIIISKLYGISSRIASPTSNYMKGLDPRLKAIVNVGSRIKSALKFKPDMTYYKGLGISKTVYGETAQITKGAGDVSHFFKNIDDPAERIIGFSKVKTFTKNRFNELIPKDEIFNIHNVVKPPMKAGSSFGGGSMGFDYSSGLGEMTPKSGLFMPGGGGSGTVGQLKIDLPSPFPPTHVNAGLVSAMDPVLIIHPRWMGVVQRIQGPQLNTTKQELSMLSTNLSLSKIMNMSKLDFKSEIIKKTHSVSIQKNILRDLLKSENMQTSLQKHLQSTITKQDLLTSQITQQNLLSDQVSFSQSLQVQDQMQLQLQQTQLLSMYQFGFASIPPPPPIFYPFWITTDPKKKKKNPFDNLWLGEYKFRSVKVPDIFEGLV
jgi:hypothetical protein